MWPEKGVRMRESASRVVTCDLWLVILKGAVGRQTDYVTFGDVQLIPISGLKQKRDICKKFKKHKNWIYVTNGSCTILTID